MEVDEWFENDNMITFEIINFGFYYFGREKMTVAHQ